MSKTYLSTKERMLLEANLKKSLPEYLSTNEKKMLEKHLEKSIMIEVKTK